MSWENPTSGDQSGFDVERAAGTTGAFAQIAATAANVLSYVDTSLTGGGAYCYRARAYNAAGTSNYSNTACGTAPTDTQPPTVSLTAPANGATVSGSAVTVSASASDNSGVAGVQFQLDGVNLNAEDTTSPYSITWNTTTATNGSHSLRAVAWDAAGNTATNTAVTVTVSNTTSPPPSGLVAAYGFNEGSGATVTDTSGNGNTGVITGASWVTAGKAGPALSFNGMNSWVTITDSALLDLTTGMTLEAWLYPTALSGGSANGFRTVIFKEASKQDVYELYANMSNNLPGGYVNINGDKGAAGSSQLPLNTWTHLASTYDGTAVRLYVNGVVVRTSTVTGTMSSSTNPLRIGGNSIWGEYFQGSIDEVRIYNRALSASQIQTDMTTPVGGTAPPPPSGLVAAYGFNEGNGATVSDASGNGNSGAITGASWVTAGKAGTALSFNGMNSWVTIPDAPLLDLTTGMTLEAWLYPTALNGGATNGFRTVLLKEASKQDVYLLYANMSNNLPGGYVNINGEQGAAGVSQLPLNTWTHLASTYDGAAVRLYVNGAVVRTSTVTGAMFSSTNPLRIGGNSIWGEYFQGSIDEVRIYNRALSASQIQTDMTTPVK